MWIGTLTLKNSWAWMSHILCKNTLSMQVMSIKVWKRHLQTQSMLLHIYWMRSICWCNKDFFFFFHATIISCTRKTLHVILLWIQTSSDLRYWLTYWLTLRLRKKNPQFFGTTNAHAAVEREVNFLRKTSSVFSRIRF